MKLIKTFRRLRLTFLTKPLNNDIYLKSFVSISFLSLLAIAIWFDGPHLIFGHYAPLMQPEKRIYVILFLYLLWLLKFLLLDLDAPNIFQYKDLHLRKKLQDLQSRFYGALKFLKKTTVAKHGKVTRLNQLPWYLLIGPTGAGKTSFLAHSGVNFILQRRFQPQASQEGSFQVTPSENCDWWVTRDTSIIDVPGKYLLSPQADKTQTSFYPILWRFFIRLIKKYHGKRGVNGIIIALPLPEIMKYNDLKKYQHSLAELFLRLQELDKIFPQPIPCHLVITKCDLLAGFNEFFSDFGHEETAQAWGIALNESQGEKMYETFTERFDALIKKLNQQLLARLHQERDPLARPYIKDFPLQIERLKEFTLDFIKKFSARNFNFCLQGTYLTSALQTPPEPESTLIEESHSTSRAIQIFKEPTSTTRAYFIKQLVANGLVATKEEKAKLTPAQVWQRRTVYVASIGIIAGSAYLLGKDFEQGVKQAYSIQNNLADYHLSTQQINDPTEHLMQTLALLESLQQSTANNTLKAGISHLLSFYSQKSEQKSLIVYQQALNSILLPEIKNYFALYLESPVNKNIDYVYASLKAYLMLGDKSHLQAGFVVNSLREILPKTLNKAKSDLLLKHVTLALSMPFNPMALNAELIDQTRKYFNTLPDLKLAYVILKNSSDNNSDSDIDVIKDAKDTPLFVSQEAKRQIPTLFTSKAFNTVMMEQSAVAANETMTGNWVLGNQIGTTKNPQLAPELTEQLRSSYISNYVEVWENLLANIHLSTPNDLLQINNMVTHLISNHSQLLQMLKTLHDNTYFEPIISNSEKLHNLGSLVDKSNSADNQLYQIFAGLDALHKYLQPILSAHNEGKAAFQAVSSRMQNRNGATLDAITQLRLIAAKSPEPIQSWLAKLANDAWNFLMQDASRYIDTSWNDQVIRFYQTEIANRYPFSANTEKDVDIKKFVRFFGNPGIVLDFYNANLQQLVDTSTLDWRWKSVDDIKLPFSDETLRQIQNAMRIHQTFFPHGDNQLHVEFALQPYKFGNHIKSVQLNVNDSQFLDQKTSAKNPHLISWPSNNAWQNTSIQLTLTNEHIINRNYTGDWGWFKLINESFDSVISKKEMLINLSMDGQPAKYLLFTDGQFNPFISLNLRHFHLPSQLTKA